MDALIKISFLYQNAISCGGTHSASHHTYGEVLLRDLRGSGNRDPQRYRWADGEADDCFNDHCAYPREPEPSRVYPRPGVWRTGLGPGHRATAIEVQMAGESWPGITITFIGLNECKAANKKYIYSQTELLFPDLIATLPSAVI